MSMTISKGNLRSVNNQHRAHPIMPAHAGAPVANTVIMSWLHAK